MDLFVRNNDLYALVRNKRTDYIQLGKFNTSQKIIAFQELIAYDGLSSFSAAIFSKNTDTIYGVFGDFKQHSWIETKLETFEFKKFELPIEMILLDIWN
jgi:hypothetical protein